MLVISSFSNPLSRLPSHRPVLVLVLALTRTDLVHTLSGTRPLSSHDPLALTLYVVLPMLNSGVLVQSADGTVVC
jgi:hypothetical protein